MGEKRSYKTYTKEFKEEAVALATIQGDKTLVELSEQYDVPSLSVRHPKFVLYGFV